MERRGFLKNMMASFTVPIFAPPALASLSVGARAAPIVAPTYTPQMFGMAVNFAKRNPQLTPQMLSAHMGLSAPQAELMFGDMVKRNVFQTMAHSAHFTTSVQSSRTSATLRNFAKNAFKKAQEFQEKLDSLDAKKTEEASDETS